MQYKNIFFGALLLVALYSCKGEKEEARMPEQYAIEDLYSTVSVYGSGFNADETKILVNSNVSGVYNAYELSIADTVSTPLTHSQKQTVFTNDYLPGSSNFIYNADNNGDENSHLYLMDRKTGKAKDLTPWPNTSNSFRDWSLGKKSLYVASNKRNVKFFDLLKIDTLTWNPKVLYENKDGLSPAGISKSERYIALTKEITTDKNELYLYNSNTKTTKRISTDQDAGWFPAAFEKNDSIMYYRTNADSEFMYVVKYNMSSGKSEKYYESKWDVTDMTISENEKYHLIYINEDGKNKVLLFDHKTGKPVDFPEFKDGDVQYAVVSKSETKLLLSVGSSTSPANLYVYDIPAKKLKQLTSTLSKKIKQDDLVKAEVVRFKSFDGKEIPAIYYKPLQASKDNKVPAVLWIHGGPGGQTRIGYSNSIQYLVNCGYAVLAVNNRGSSGYGKTFYKLDNKDHSNGD